MQLRDAYDEITARGAGAVAIGMGSPEAAAAFRDRYDIPFPVLVDHTKHTYRALGLRRGSLNDIIGPKVWGPGARAVRRVGVSRPKQDPYQLGGVMVVSSGGDVLFAHLSDSSSDWPPVEEVLRALP